ncbi:cyclic nucleotide-gated ion channel 1-like [Prunus yedoensis var. nudiflora]|uniref:Cyclic nucleotide-gated ion channel 1-like n=1 Tax=Prunus yedoensis var. nudiflora TaxID=2094558 RepID=A0A314V4J9_PRUYE|nr:cyclic nucleotide-gated ion channel 1-like [Prunus yedoensis var. nudiflora]
MLKIICNKMKLKTFKDNTLVVEPAHPLERMMIIIEGSLRMYQTTSDSATAAEATPPQTTVFKEGDIVGHELVSWAASIRNFNDPPVSNKYVYQMPLQSNSLRSHK